jgi:3-deoxy-D-manno-octulosonic acid kinase
VPSFKHWTTGPEVRLKPIDGGAMLYDASRAGNAEAGWLDAGWWARRGSVTLPLEGRGGARFIEADGRSLVLRHYRRGGFAAHISADRYLWRGEAATRSFSEWQLLYQLQRAELPVPVPIAAAYRRRGYGYTADLLIERIAGAQSLDAALSSAALPVGSWVAVGRCLRRFHHFGVWHADLNARNVLLGEQEQVWIVDFDRGTLREPGWWCDANLVRLRRSLDKIAAALPAERFSSADWSSLLDGYFAADIEFD